MNRWGIAVGTAAALGSALAVMVILARRQAQARAVPDLIADCFDRIHRIEAELQRVNPEVTATS